MQLIPIATRKLNAKYELYMIIIVTMAMRYVANVYCPKEAFSKCGLNTAKELLTYHCVCQGNLVTIAMKYSSIYYEGTGHFSI